MGQGCVFGVCGGNLVGQGCVLGVFGGCLGGPGVCLVWFWRALRSLCGQCVRSRVTLGRWWGASSELEYMAYTGCNRV